MWTPNEENGQSWWPACRRCLSALFVGFSALVLVDLEVEGVPGWGCH